LTYRLVDIAFDGAFPDPIINLMNATNPFDLFLQSAGRTPAFEGTPKNYTVEPFSIGKGYGLVAALNLVKLPTGYTLLWNVQA
jgi:hypothetical protein